MASSEKERKRTTGRKEGRHSEKGENKVLAVQHSRAIYFLVSTLRMRATPPGLFWPEPKRAFTETIEPTANAYGTHLSPSPPLAGAAAVALVPAIVVVVALLAAAAPAAAVALAFLHGLSITIVSGCWCCIFLNAGFAGESTTTTTSSSASAFFLAPPTPASPALPELVRAEGEKKDDILATPLVGVLVGVLFRPLGDRATAPLGAAGDKDNEEEADDEIEGFMAAWSCADTANVAR